MEKKILTKLHKLRGAINSSVPCTQKFLSLTIATCSFHFAIKYVFTISDNFEIIE